MPLVAAFKVSRHGVEPALAPRRAPKQPFYGKKTALYKTELFVRFHRINGAAGRINTPFCALPLGKRSFVQFEKRNCQILHRISPALINKPFTLVTISEWRYARGLRGKNITLYPPTTFGIQSETTAFSWRRIRLRFTALPYFLLTENPTFVCLLLLAQYSITKFLSATLCACL